MIILKIFFQFNDDKIYMNDYFVFIFQSTNKSDKKFALIK